VKVVGILMALLGGTISVLCFASGGPGHEAGTCLIALLIFLLGLFFCFRKKSA
jgi:hypothetical protein